MYMKLFWRLFPWLTLLFHGKIVWFFVMLGHIWLVVLFLVTPIRSRLFERWLSRWIPFRRFPAWYIFLVLTLLVFWSLFFLLRKFAISTSEKLWYETYSISYIHCLPVIFFVFVFAIWWLSTSLLSVSPFGFDAITEVQFLTSTMREYTKIAHTLDDQSWEDSPKIASVEVISELKNWWTWAWYYLMEREYYMKVSYVDESWMYIIVARNVELWNQSLDIAVLHPGHGGTYTVSPLYWNELYWKWRTFTKNALENPHVLNL